MPVKKTAAKKAVAKKPAAKSAAPALAKKVTTAKTKSTKSASAPAASGAPKNLGDLAKKIVTAITAGEFDGWIGDIDNAVNERISAQAVANAKPAKKTADSKSVSAAPKRAAKTSAPVEVEAGKTYKVGAKPAKLAGAKVKFIRHKVDDDTKAVLEMMVDKPGYPKGKRVVLPVSALTK